MNRLLVRMTTAAYATVLLEQVPAAAERGVVVGFDARHQSDVMAYDTCAVLAGAGIRVHFLATPQPTPLAAFAVLHLSAAGGIVLTASHNPPAYSGYKVFWANGVQIIPPVDTLTSAALDTLEPDQTLPWLEHAAARRQGLLLEYGEDLETAYLQAIRRNPTNAAAGPDIVYTPMHGVAGSLAVRALQQQGFTVSNVDAQFRPDGDFPTLDFPNPEKPAALALAIDQARREGAGLVLANDPDGDRMAVAVPAGGGHYQPLSGDQIGWLLADYILASYGDDLPAAGFVVNTIVSSTLLSRIAASYGIHCEQTLSGLIWVWNRALERERDGGTFLFAYEEAIGYSVCPQVRDKDGISAAVLFAELARACAAEGISVLERLDDIYRRVGVAATRQISIPLPGQNSGTLGRVLRDRLRRHPPVQFGSRPVLSISDFQNRQQTDRSNGRVTALTLPPGNVMQFQLSGGGRVIIRPSGTEPIVKIYLECYLPYAQHQPLKELKDTVGVELDELESDAMEVVLTH
jgi:phosphomannomutase